MALAIGSQSEGGVHSHARRAIAAGAATEEIEHVVLLSITSIGFTKAVAAWTWVNDAFAETKRHKPPKSGASHRTKFDIVYQNSKHCAI